MSTSIADALNHATFCSTDSSGDRLTESDAFGNTTYTYNSFGQVLTATDPIGGVWTYTLVIRNGMMLTLIGLALGLAGAFALTRLVSTILFGVTSTDVATFVGVSLTLMVVALIACYIPACSHARRSFDGSTYTEASYAARLNSANVDRFLPHH